MRKSSARAGAVGAVMTMAGGACSSAPATTGTFTGDGGEPSSSGSAGTGSSSSSGAGNTSSSGSGTASSSGSGAPVCTQAFQPMGYTAALPLLVSQIFGASGYEGDGETAGNITQGMCGAGDAPDAGITGTCYTWSYTPGAMGWAAVEWLNNGDGVMYGNWGELPGIAAPVGAENVTFWAKTETPGLQVKFSAGGLTPSPTAATPTYCGDTDSTTTLSVTLTSSWTQYTLPLAHTTTSADLILGAFNWSIGGGTGQDAGAGGTGPYSFEVSNIAWTQ